MAAPATLEERFEMGITRAEFLRLLPLAVGADPIRDEGTAREAYRGRAGGVAWRIALDERPPRRIALLALPVLEVTVSLRAPRPEAMQEFVARFLLTYQRAGG